MSLLRGSAVVVAVVVSIGLTQVAQVAQAQRLGRLFSTPEERLQLDELRREYEYGQPAEPEPQSTATQVEAPKGPTFSQFTINGVVLRSNGGGSTWVNGARVSQGTMTREGVRVDAGDRGQSVKIVLPSGADTIELKAGQKIDVVSGAVLDAYEYQGSDTSTNAFGNSAAAAPDGPLGAIGATLESKAKDAVKAVKGAQDSLKKLLETQ